ncbi:MAG TPA: hypothetical protein VHZ26_13605 [Caulobacteraceae bacterium]|jgi:hypothetical protein|nr:hypothetical protein [Caulobacteraceae bacterium]
MTDEILIAGLKRKYAELAGALRQARKTAHALKEDMATVRATLKLFSAEAELAGVKPIAPSQTGKLFVKGQCSRTALDVLRTATEPLTVRQIAERVVEATGIGPLGSRDMQSVCDAVKHAFMGRRDLVTATKDRPQRWALAGRE